MSVSVYEAFGLTLAILVYHLACCIVIDRLVSRPQPRASEAATVERVASQPRASDAKARIGGRAVEPVPEVAEVG